MCDYITMGDYLDNIFPFIGVRKCGLQPLVVKYQGVVGRYKIPFWVKYRKERWCLYECFSSNKRTKKS